MSLTLVAPGSSTGPAPHQGTLEALRRLDRRIQAMWSDWYLDYSTLQPLVKENGDRIDHPRWHLVLTEENGRRHHLFCWENEEREFLPLDQRIVTKIASDVARHMSPDEVNRYIDECQASGLEGRRKFFEDLREQMIQANRSKIERTLEDPDKMRQGPSPRDGLITSYPGQGNRASRWDAIDTNQDDPKRHGWEIPDWDDEMARHEEDHARDQT